MYHTTGFSRDNIVDLCALIYSEIGDEMHTWPPILGLFKSVVVTLTYMRRNRVQAEIAETFEVSQPTISRAITAVTPLLGEVLGRYVPTADELDLRRPPRGLSTSWMAPCFRAGRGRLTHSCTPGSTRRPV
jgi:hypothetical protein